MRFLPLVALFACNPVPDGPPGDCDPLNPGVCAFPFPNSFFLREDDSTETGYRIDFREGTLPVNRDDVPMTPDYWNERDGFSINGPILVWLDEVSLDGVIGHEDLAAYADPDAMTAIVDTVTGERVPHFVELDMTAQNPHERVLMLRPVVPLDFDRDYVVGLRGFEYPDGNPVQPSAAFAALRDGHRSSDPDVQRRRDHFDELVFPALEDAGFPREDLLLAWDFHTASHEGMLGRMEHIRSELVADWGTEGPAYTIHDVQDHDCGTEHIGRTIVGTITVPLFTEEDGPGTFLTRDADGLPYENGTTEAPFLVRVPCSVLEDPAPSMVLQYGHGLLGHRDEARTGWLSKLADEQRWIVVATDWTGMSEADVGDITLMLAIDVSDFAMLPERSHQGLAQQMALTRLAKTGLVTDENLVVTPEGGDPVALIDPDRVTYYGNSQGGVMGGALMGMSPDLERGVLGVTGAPYNLLLSRSADFDPFFLIFKNKYDDHREIALVLGLVQILWDPTEGGGWTHDVAASPAGLPDKHVLIQNAIYDAQVSTLGGHYQARGYGAVSISPQTRPVWGIEEKDGPWTGNAIVEWEYTDLPDEPVENTPPDAQVDPHECVRRDPAGQAQVAEFLTTGVIENHCDGRCTAIQEGCR